MTTARPHRFLDRTLWPACALLVATLALFELTNLDLWLQNQFYNFHTHAWLVAKTDPVPRFFFYHGPKWLLATLGVALLVLALGPTRWRARFASPAWRRRDLFVVILTLASGPALIGFCKAKTNVFTPAEVRDFGGDVRYVKTFERFPADDRPPSESFDLAERKFIERQGRGFPAGHASGGFALLALAGLARTATGRRRGVLIGLAAGWSMGLYQMLNGEHYLSHTLVTMLVSWIVFLVWRRLLRATE